MHVVGIQVWRQSSFANSMYSWSQQMRRALCPSKASSGANNVYNGLIHLQVAPHLPAMHPTMNMSMAHSQYLLFHNSGIVNTGISELSLYIYIGVRHTV